MIACQERLKAGAEVFNDLRNQAIYESCLQLSDKNIPADLLTLSQHLRNRNRLDDIGGIAYLNEIQDACQSPANLIVWIDEVESKHTLRKLIEFASNLVDQAATSQDANALLDSVEKTVLAIRPTRNNSPDIRQLTKQAISKLEYLFENQGSISGLSTGLADVDRITDGMHGGEMIVVAGFPSTGKTALACGMAVHNSLEGIPCAIFSAEMQPVQLVVRAMCSDARLNKRRMENEKLAAVVNSVGRFSNAPLYIEQASGMTIGQLTAAARRLKQKQNIQVIVVDYIQLLIGVGDNREQQIANISKGLKAIALELNCAVLALSQLTDDGKLRESRAIGQDADSVWKLANDGDWKPLIQPIKLNIEKCRDGETGSVALTFFKEFTRFECVSKFD